MLVRTGTDSMTYPARHPLPTNFLLLLLLPRQEPANASQMSKETGGIARLVSWASPPEEGRGGRGVLDMTTEDNAKTSSCLGIIRR